MPHNPDLVAFINLALSKGFSPNDIEKILVSHGWNRIEVNRAILDRTMGEQEIPEAPSLKSPPKESFKDRFKKATFDRKFLINAIVIAIVVSTLSLIIFSKIGLQQKHTPIVNQSISSVQIEKNISSWCRVSTRWSDPSIISQEAFIVKGTLKVGNETLCYATQVSNSSISYRFSFNNQRIWKMESKPTGNSSIKNLVVTKIK
jgi:uncharacterized membrane protein